MIRWSKKYLEMQTQAVIVLWKDMGLYSSGHQITAAFTETIDDAEWREQWNAWIDEIAQQHDRIWNGGGHGYDCYKLELKDDCEPYESATDNYKYFEGEE